MRFSLKSRSHLWMIIENSGLQTCYNIVLFKANVHNWKSQKRCHPFLRFNNVSSIHEIHGRHRAWFGVLLKHVKKPNTIVVSQRNRQFNATYTIYKRKIWSTVYLGNFSCFWKERFSRLWWTLPHIISISWSAVSECASTLKSLKKMFYFSFDPELMFDVALSFCIYGN